MISCLLCAGSIEEKLRRINLLTIGSAFVIAIVLLTAYDYVSLSSELVENSRAKAQLIGRNSASALVFDDAKAATELLGSLAEEEQVLFAALWNEQGTRLASYRAAGYQAEAISQRPSHGYELTASVLDIARPVSVDGKGAGTVALRVEPGQALFAPAVARRRVRAGDPDGAVAVACLAIPAQPLDHGAGCQSGRRDGARVARGRLLGAGAHRFARRNRRPGQSFNVMLERDRDARPAPRAHRDELETKPRNRAPRNCARAKDCRRSRPAAPRASSSPT